MNASAAPLYVFDAYSRNPADRHRFYADDMHPRMLAWMRDQCLRPGGVWRFEVYLKAHLGDCPLLRVWEYLLDEGGYPYCELEHPHRGRSCVIAQREPYTVIASCLPPILVATP